MFSDDAINLALCDRNVLIQENTIICLIALYGYEMRIDLLYGVKHCLDNVSVIASQPVHLSILSWNSFNQYSICTCNILSKPQAALPCNYR